VQGNVTWFQNCSGISNQGRVLSISLTNCDSASCDLEAGEPLRLVLNFLAGESYENLLYKLRLLNTRTNASYLLAQGNGILPVQKGEEYFLGTNFRINGTVPSDTDYSLQILRYGPTDNSTEVCAVFPIGSVSNNLPTDSPTTEDVQTTTELETEATTLSANTTTTTTTTTTTPEPGQSTSRPIYNCDLPGIFPDPFDCQIFHVCTLFPNGTIWDQELHCASDTVYCDRIKICEYEPLCPCSLPTFQ
jgi:hypothetical protein